MMTRMLPAAVLLIVSTQALLPPLLGAAARRGSPALLACDADDSARQQDSLPPWLLDRMETLGWGTPTTVQQDSLHSILAGKDMIIQAKTGSGKTLAYMLPLIAMLRPQSSVQALVLLPTRELASQVALVARRLAAASPERLLVMALMDGSGARRQRRWLVAQPPQLVVGNVQQVDAVLKARLLRLESLRMLVVDEVDACLADERTSALLQRMLGGQLAVPTSPPPSRASAGRQATASRGSSSPSPLTARQTLFVSASLPQREHFRRQCEQQRWCRAAPLLVHSEPEQLLPTQLRHGWAPCSASKRVAGLRVRLRRRKTSPLTTHHPAFITPQPPLTAGHSPLAGAPSTA